MCSSDGVALHRHEIAEAVIAQISGLVIIAQSKVLRSVDDLNDACLACALVANPDVSVSIGLLSIGSCGCVSRCAIISWKISLNLTDTDWMTPHIVATLLVTLCRQNLCVLCFHSLTLILALKLRSKRGIHVSV